MDSVEAMATVVAIVEVAPVAAAAVDMATVVILVEAGAVAMAAAAAVSGVASVVNWVAAGAGRAATHRRRGRSMSGHGKRET